MPLHPSMVNDQTGVLQPYLHVPGFVGTSAQRIGYSTSFSNNLTPSVQWYETDTHNTWQWQGTSTITWFPIVSTSAVSVLSGITALTGDGTATGPGSAALTLATVNTNVGTFGSATQIPAFIVNGKGLTTSASNVAIAIPPTQITGGTSGQYLGQSSSNVPTWITLKAPTVQRFTTGTGTYTTPTSPVPLYVKVDMIGGGGGGAGSGSTPTASTSGGTTVFGLASAGGGLGNQSSGGVVGGVGGTVSVAYTTLVAVNGGDGASASGSITENQGGNGGVGFFGGAGYGGPFGTAGTSAATNSGAGGGGGGTGGTAGTNTGVGGGSGGYQSFMVPSPSTSYSYVVGGGGAGGNAGSGGFAGGAGGSGVIVVQELYF